MAGEGEAGMRHMSGEQLSKRVTLQTATETRDTDGSVIQTWSDTATVRAAVEPLVGREYWAAQQINAERTVRFRIRYRSGVTPKMRVSYDSRVFDIKSAINVNERGRELVLMCEEVV